MYLILKPSSIRSLTRESGTFLLSSLRMSERGLLIPAVGMASSSELVEQDTSRRSEDKDFVKGEPQLKGDLARVLIAIEEDIFLSLKIQQLRGRGRASLKPLSSCCEISNSFHIQNTVRQTDRDKEEHLALSCLGSGFSAQCNSRI